MDFARADGETDETPADATEADAELPDDHDGTEDADDGESAVQDGQTVELMYLPEDDDREYELAEAVEANAEELTHRAPEHRVDKLEKTIDGLREENRDLQDQIDALEERIKSLEGWRGSTVSTVNRNISDINRLTAAVFDTEPPCPECENGHLEADTGGFGADKVACTDCEYEQELG